MARTSVLSRRRPAASFRTRRDPGSRPEPRGSRGGGSVVRWMVRARLVHHFPVSEVGKQLDIFRIGLRQLLSLFQNAFIFLCSSSNMASFPFDVFAPHAAFILSSEMLRADSGHRRLNVQRAIAPLPGCFLTFSMTSLFSSRIRLASSSCPSAMARQ